MRFPSNISMYGCIIISISIPLSYAFVVNTRNFGLFSTTKQQSNSISRSTPCSSALVLKSTESSSTSFENKRAEILNRGESFFELDEKDGFIEFGSTARLLTTLEKNPGAKPVIAKWLSKEKRVAASIWDPTLMQTLGNSEYTLEVTTIQFITLVLAPKITVAMWTEKITSSGKEEDYIFKIESISFDPNIQLLSLPGMPSSIITAQDLGLNIEVVGELGLSKDGTGLSGAIGFRTQGTLPRLMRLLPKSIIQNTVDIVNKQIISLAITNFQKGAIMEYGKYRLEVIAEYEKRKQATADAMT